MVIVDIETTEVIYLSDIYEGRTHDKKVCDKEKYSFYPNSSLHQDTAFQGHNPPNATVYQPKKKPRGGELTAEEKEANSLISKVRVRVEHAIAGIKRCRIVKDVLRNTKQGFAE